MRAAQLVGTALCLFGCASAPAAVPTRAPATAIPIATGSVTNTSPPASTRDLGADATFADLVRSARLAIQAGHQDSNTGCLLSGGNRTYVLSADLMPALDELPDASADLDAELLQSRKPIRVLSAWGQIGTLEPGLVLAAFTAFGAENLHQPALALLQTDQGVYLRYSDAPADERDGPMTIEAAIARVLAAPHNAGAALYITAEAAVPAAKLAELLRLLPANHSVALVLALPANTRVPLPSAQPSNQRCADGLPDPNEGSVEGALDARAILDALAPLRVSAQACLEQARGAARAGGRLTLALRIAANGQLQDGCVQDDAMEDAQLELCVLAGARALRFPVPNPTGFVDVRLPLALTPASTPQQRPLCE